MANEYQVNEADLQRIDAYLHDLLSVEEAEAFERDCEANPLLKAALSEAGKRLLAVQSLPPTEASDALVKQALRRIEAAQGSRSHWRTYYTLSGLGLAAAAAIVLGLLNLHYLYLTPTPYNLELLGQTTLLANTEASLRIRLTNRATGSAQAGVPVDILIANRAASEPTKLASFTTDSLGTGQPRFKLPDWADGSYELKVIAYTPGQAEQASHPITLKRSWKLMLSTDKPVYQPGQTIHLRGLALRRPDLKPIAGQDITFSITDPKGNIIFKRKDVTSKFGIAAAGCELATEIIPGSYQIACQIGDTRSETSVEVSRYVLPKFKVEITLEEPYYKPREKVKGTVFANYFFGKPVAGAVEIKVTTTEVKPTTLKTFSVRLNRAGEADFEFTLPEKLIGTEQDSGDARINVTAKVIDTAGQEQVRTVSRLVTASPLRTTLIVENGSLVQNVPNRIFVYATYVTGRPARDVRLKVSGIDKELVTSDLGVAMFEIKPTDDEVELTITASDRAGATITKTQRLACGSASGQDFLLRTDRAVYNGGESMKLSVLGAGVEPVFVDFIKDGQTMLTTTVDVREGHGEYVFDLPADLFGTIDILAYRFDAMGLPVRKSRVVYVKQAGGLKISTVFNQDAFRPGERAKISLELTDDQGNPKPGAISLAAVDEAVFSVMTQAPGMEKTFFTLEQERLKPVYAIYDWTPDMPARGPRQDQNEFEQALFSRTVRQGQAPLCGIGNGIPLARPTIPNGDPAGVLSLWINSYPVKYAGVEHRREAGLELVHRFWWWYAFGVAVMLYLALWFYVRPLWIVFALHGVLLFFLCGGTVMLLLIMFGGLSAPKTGFDSVDAQLNRFGAVKSEAMPALSPAVPPRGLDDVPEAAADTPVRVREYFPETLFWRPEIITDDNGLAEIEVDLADSITTWRLSASAITTEGQLGGLQSTLRVYQPFFVDFNLPVTLTRGDIISLPVVVNNYLNQEQQVELKLEQEPWFELLEGELEQKLTVDPSAVRSVSFRIKVKNVGRHTLQVTARSRLVADAIKRPIEVVPDGLASEQVVNGNLQQPAIVDINLPAEAIEGSGKLLVKVYPSSFSQLIEGLEGLFQQPYGCFEQTSSTTYPNVLALDYLRRTKRSMPEVEAKARQYIHLGYQRLLGFEVSGGGFDWFGNPPANQVLTAYGLMEFQDMARVHDVDPNLIRRTRSWLLRRRAPDGSWTPESHKLHSGDPTVSNDRDLEKYSTTAYIAWAVFGDQHANQSPDASAGPTLNYLLARQPAEFQDPYVLALAINALQACGVAPADVRPYLARLDSLKRQSPDGKLAWWEQAPLTRTTFYGQGASGSVETTALASIALLQAQGHPATCRSALSWLVQQRKSSGTFGSTQATVLALKALLMGTDRLLGSDMERQIEVSVGEHKTSLKIPADQDGVMQLLNLSEQLRPGRQRLELMENTGTGAGFQVVFRYHVPEPDVPPVREPLSIELNYDRTNLAVGDSITVEAVITNNLAETAPMVILDLPIPAGFAVNPDDWLGLVKDSRIDKYQINARSVVVYLRGLPSNRPLRLTYQLKATMPVKLSVPGARAYEYYNEDSNGRSRPVGIEVK